MSFSESTRKFQKLSKRVTYIAFAVAAVVCIITFIVLGVSLNNNGISVTAAIVVACVIAVAMIGGLFLTWFLLNRINLKYLEEARASEEEANKVKSVFLANMSHDIRTPLNAVMGLTEIAIANIDDSEQVENCLKKISISSRQLLVLINDILDMSEIRRGNLTLKTEEFSLSEVVGSVAATIKPHIKLKKQQFDVNVHDVFAEKVYSDGVRFNQVLLNLLSNAYKFTPDNGKIELSLYQEKSPLGDKYARTHITVQDNGIGMSKEFQKRIFNSFTREDSSRADKTEGTGLGLSITKYIIDSLHGAIDVDSKLGEGTRFHVVVDLEIAQSGEVGGEAEQKSKAVDLKGKRLLVAEDNNLNWEIANLLLTSEGFIVEHAENGQLCVDMLLAHKVGYYDAILMDVRMPVMSGFEATTVIRGLRRGYNKVPIIAMTADAFAEDMQKCLDCGMNAHIAKPIDIDVVKATLAKFINRDNQ